MSSSEEEAEFDGGDAGEDDEAFEQEEEEEVSSDEEDEPLSSLKKSPSPGRQRSSIAVKKPSYKEASSDEDNSGSSSSDDDDAPLSSLVAKKPAAAKVNGTNNKKTATKKKETPKKKKATSTKKPPPKKASSSVTNGNSAPSATSGSGKSKSYEWASAALYGSECEKGLLIQRLLCRWWYAFEWPDPATLPARPPANYDALDGFPGVYIGTAAENVGQIQDLRNAKAAPTFVNFARKSAEELRDLLATALQQQTQQLVAAEGSGTTTEKELAILLKWAKKVNVAKADKEAAKVLKAQGLSLDSFEL